MTTFEQVMEEQRTTQSLIARMLPAFNKMAKPRRTVAAIQSRLNSLQIFWDQWQRQHSMLLGIASDEERRTHEYFVTDKFLNTCDVIDDTRDTLSEALESLQVKNPAVNRDASHNQTGVRAGTVHLTPIDVPKFSGEVTQWEEFRDLFQALVVNRGDLTNVQKLHYLKTSLTGEARFVLPNTRVTEANYETVWGSLCKKFDNPRAIVYALLRSFVDIPSMTTPSVHDLKLLLDKTNDIYTALLNLKRPVNQWEDLMIFLTVDKLDTITRTDWELSLGDSVELPNFAELDGFLSARVRALSSVPVTNPVNPKSEPKSSNKSNVVKAHQTVSKSVQCTACNGGHPINHCKSFINSTVDQHVDLLKRNKCCFNCLRKRHFPWSCRSGNVCTLCKKKHHTLIHRDNVGALKLLPPTLSEPDTRDRKAMTGVVSESDVIGDVSSNNFITQPVNDTVLPTAMVCLKSRSGRMVKVRALLDQGSQATFVSESVAQLLRADRRSVSVSISGISGMTNGKARCAASFTIEPCVPGGPVLAVWALILPKVTAYVPKPFGPATSKFLQYLNLADSVSENKEKIELIIGADYYGSVLRKGLLHEHNGRLTAQLTIFGWVVYGPSVRASSDSVQPRISINHAEIGTSLDDLLRRFWELEQVTCRPLLSAEDAKCETHFRNTHSRLSDGRYMVRLPFKTDPPIPIGETARDVKRIFLSNESRILRQPDVSLAYRTFMREYEELHHMEKVPYAELNAQPSVYLPHHAVIKVNGQTTKVRVVFNASRTSSSKSSLNDHLLVGPKLQADLFALILKWRSYRFVYSADLEKMFRQIRVHPSDTDYQRILWRNDPNSELLVYRLTTETYGTACAPFLANRVLKQLAIDQGATYPLTATVLKSNVYVDDLMFGADDVVSLQQIRAQLTQLLMAGGFHTHKWACNETSLLTDSPPAEQNVAINKTLGEEASHRVLGISWCPRADVFRLQVLLNVTTTFTKRTFLSLLARLYDPLGWVAPVTITAKIILQMLWLRKVGWDERVPEDIERRCLEYQSQLTLLSKVVIPRWTGQGSESLHIQVHGFSDASNAAYAAVVYLRIESNLGFVRISLLYAKTKVAPLKVQSVPRLELCGALLLVRAIDFVKKSMNLFNATVYCWTDSTVVLAWLRAVPARWTPFVANRVSEIITVLPNANWRHVPTLSNPADCASRGISAEVLISHPLWWTGPLWLKSVESKWPVGKVDAMTDLETRKTAHMHSAQTQCSWNLPEEVSSWSRLLRITAYVRRFVHNARNKQSRITLAYLTAEEIRQATMFWIKTVQARYFGRDIRALKNKEFARLQSALLSLTPYVDSAGILRVGRRLRFSDLSENAKFPVILPKCRICELLIHFMHLRTLHGGTPLTLRMLREHYWVIGARAQVKRCVFKCVTCTRQRATMSGQRMGDLPSIRVKPSRPFSNTGVDYAGPFNMRAVKGRGHKTYKAYCVLFICMATRAIHIEIANDYTTEGFLAAFERFAARRGLPSIVFSDNGTNFREADRELSRRIREINNNPDLQNRFATEQVTWRFIPPAAPYFGGLWEAGVKSVKFHLRRILGEFTPTFEEFSTLLCKIECILNSRPLAPLFDDPDNFDVLTPGHFLVGSNLKAVPNISVCDVNMNRLSRWQAIQRLQETFWKIWSADYLNSLQQRNKWRLNQVNLKVGDLVLMRDANLPPSKWSLGRVIECNPGKDDLVRVVTIKTAKSIFKRPITQLCRLPVESGDVAINTRT